MKVIVTLKVKDSDPVSKATLYSWFGIVAEFIAENGSFDIVDVDIVGDEIPKPQPIKARKPRGPNKPKAPPAPPPAQLDIEGGNDAMPSFLKRSS